MKILTASLRRLSFEMSRASEASFWAEKIKSRFGLPSRADSEIDGIYWILRETYNILRLIPPALIKDCGVTALIFKYLGENKPLYPNHGFFRESDKTVTLNSDMFIHPDQPEDFFDGHRYFITRSAETLYHEFGHGFDACHGELSLQPAWMKLSGWSKEPGPGLERLHIKDREAPEVIGEYYYDSKYKANGFTRFYAMRNPWDDMADSFSFFISGMKDRVPDSKRVYLDKLLKKYY
jgi:hypothetical protein